MAQLSGSNPARYARFLLILMGAIQLGLAALFAIGLGGIPFAARAWS